MNGELLGTSLVLGFVLACGYAHAHKGAVRAWLARQPVDLDAADGIHTHRPADDASTGSAGRCTNHRPHRMLPTEYGWKCGNDGCHERWHVEAGDELAAADLALWEIENDWEVEA